MKPIRAKTYYTHLYKCKVQYCGLVTGLCYRSLRDVHRRSLPAWRAQHIPKVGQVMNSEFVNLITRVNYYMPSECIEYKQIVRRTMGMSGGCRALGLGRSDSSVDSRTQWAAWIGSRKSGLASEAWTGEAETGRVSDTNE